MVAAMPRYVQSFLPFSSLFRIRSWVSSGVNVIFIAMIRVVIYSKEDCCLCAEAKKTLQKIAVDFPIQIQEIDITSHPEIHNLYKEDIPVVTIQGKRAFRYKVHETTLRKKLEKILKHQANESHSV